MESITNVASAAANAASRVVFGDNKESTSDSHGRNEATEPVSGVTGPRKPSEPYDGGNAEENQPIGGLAGSRDGGYQSTSDTTRDTSYQEGRSGDAQSAIPDEATSSLTERRLDPGPVESGISRDTPQYEGTSSFGNTSGSTGAAGYSTYTASRLDPRIDGRGNESSTLASGSSYTAVEGPDTTRTSYETYESTDNLGSRRNDDDQYGPGMSGGTNAQRLLEHNDTETRPSGGIAQGGQPQGINVTWMTGQRGGDPNFKVLDPTSADQPSIPSGGQTRAPMGGFGVVEPSVGADPTSGQKPMEEYQGGYKPTEAPSDDAVEAIRRSKEETEQAARSSGMELGHGPAGPTGYEGGGAGHGGFTERGTGEKYVKSTGLAAEGGDFDAAAPGAGKEAQRLIDEKGLPQGEVSHHHHLPTKSHSHSSSSHDQGGHGGVGEKLKEKLHLGGGH